jgi:diguanylate cyclase (GGDEF)-like protein/PAS domain S-box-containing protein
MPKRLEALLGQSLLHTTPHAIVAVNSDQIIGFFNAAAETIFGLTAAAAHGQPLDILIPEAARPQHQAHVREFAAGPEQTRRMGERGEIRGRRADGTTFPAEASIIKLNFDGEEFLVAIINDLSDRKALEQERQRLAEILESTPDLVGMADTAGHVLYQNPAARQLLGHDDQARVTDCQVQDFHPAPHAERVLEEALPVAEKQGYWEGETAFIGANGEEIPASQLIIAHRDEQGDTSYFSTLARDLRPYKQAQQELRKLTRALTQTADMVWITDPAGRVEFVNPAFEAATGFGHDEAVGRQIAELLKSGQHDQGFYQQLWDALKRGEDFRDVFTNRTRDGRTLYIDETISPVVDASGELTHFIATGRDISERFRLEERLRELAYYDPVTGLPNRSHFEEHLELALPTAQRNGQFLAVIFIDLDRFKYVNDTLGHAAGDQVLTQAGRRLSGCLRQGDLLARLGGDEFACLPEPVKDARGAMRVAEKLLATFAEPFEVEGQSFGLQASLGISFFPDTAEDGATLIRQADTAMFHAKQAGGNQYRFFSQALSEATAQRFHFEKGLRQAVDQEAVQAFFQPILTLAGHTLAGAEALARCELPGLGWVSPGQFIPVAEETGLIHPLGEQMLAEACRQTQAWREAGYSLAKIAINLSPIQLEAGDFGRRVESILDRTGLPAASLALEVTEEAVLSGETAILRRLEELREMGIEIALDDFGTGYSSPAYLKRLPAQRLKIDRSFIRHIDHDRANQTILDSLLVLAEGFGFRTTAEGLEEAPEEAYLSRCYCHEVQGFLYGRPAPPDDFARGPLVDFQPPAPQHG